MDLFDSARSRVIVVERNWQNVSELGVFRVVETVTLEMVNLLWSRDLCAMPFRDLPHCVRHIPLRLRGGAHVYLTATKTWYHLKRFPGTK